MELDRYFELLKQDKAQVREELRPSATERVKRSLVLGQLADSEKIEVADADIDAEIERLIAGASGGDDQQIERYRQIFRSPEARASLSRSLQTRKTLERLVEIASQDGTDPQKTPRSKKTSDEAETETETPSETSAVQEPEAEMAKEEA
jgi:trigger factor